MEAPDIVHAAATAIMTEVLTCQKDANKKSREAASELLHFFLHQAPVDAMFDLLQTSLRNATSASLRSSALQALSTQLVFKRENDGLLSEALQLLPHISSLLQVQNLELSRAVLGFLRVCINVLPRETIMEVARVVVPSIFVQIG